MSGVKKTTQVVSPPKNDSDMARENNDMAREEILHQASPDARMLKSMANGRPSASLDM